MSHLTSYTLFFKAFVCNALLLITTKLNSVSTNSSEPKQKVQGKKLGDTGRRKHNTYETPQRLGKSSLFPLFPKHSDMLR